MWSPTPPSIPELRRTSAAAVRGRKENVQTRPPRLRPCLSPEACRCWPCVLRLYPRSSAGTTSGPTAPGWSAQLSATWLRCGRWPERHICGMHPEEDVFHSYNHRCTVETTIRTLKDDWALDAFSSRAFAANAADMRSKVIAYNLLLIMQTLVAPRDRGVVHTAATLRRMWFLLPAVMSPHAGHWQLRLSMYAGTGPYAHARQAPRVLSSSA